MANKTVKDLPDAVQPAERVRLGTMLASIAREAGGLSDAEVAEFNGQRDRTPAASCPLTPIPPKPPT